MNALIYPQHELFEPYRELAERSPLALIQIGDEVEIRFTPVFIPSSIQFYFFGQPDATISDPSQRADWFWYRQGGLNTLSHLKTWPGRINNNGLRLGFGAHHYPYLGLNAYETIGFGAGTLRPRIQTFGGFRTHLEKEESGSGKAAQIGSRAAKKIGYLIQDLKSTPEGWQPTNIVYQSSNVVMPEVVGELQQLYARRDDKALQEAYVKQLLRVCTKVPIEIQHSPGLCQPGINTTPLVAPLSFQYVETSYAIAHLQHLENGFYDEFPKTRSGLIERVEDLLSRIIFDTYPIIR